jgi:hypothetical protein
MSVILKKSIVVYLCTFVPNKRTFV